jgi:hypothetical protein
MRFLVSLSFAFFAFFQISFGQKQPVTYFLPDIQYDRSIPTPEQLFGFQIGEWHLSHDQLLSYYRLLDEASERITLYEYARSHEQRPLIYLVITSKKNHENIQAIQNQHVALCDPSRSGSLDISKMPVVVYQGFSIHGNEPSGANGAPLVAYYLAAGQGAEMDRLLDETVIIFDPVFNADGFHRFSTWANMHRNQNLTADNADREYDEAWPRGRTNHYWFDLNRDWLPGQQPESAGRIRNFQAWKPNILTDHHEMGTNSTFFFMPGIQSRVNPVTPMRNQELTFKIGEFHARALDEIGSLYYTQENYDDFYFGKGSTYPDAQGCIGILFEQASSRGHLQDTPNGPLSFAFTIRNQVKTALSTQKAAVAMRAELLDYQRNFYKNAIEEASRDERKAFVMGEKYDHARLMKFVELVERQDVKVYELAEKITVNGKTYEPGNACIIPLEQAQYKLILGMFQRETSFTDSIFYDVSAWTLPLAFNLEYDALNGKVFSKKLLGRQVEDVQLSEGQVLASPGDYAFAFEWDEYYAPAALYYLLKNELLVKVASKPFDGHTRNGLLNFNYGTIVIGTQNQPRQGEELLEILREAAGLGHLTIYGLTTGLTPEGIDVGSNYMEPLKQPKVLLLAGDGVSSYDAGEIWHLLDTRYQVPVTKVESDRLSAGVLDRFNVVIMAGGSYNRLNQEVLKNWVSAGGTLIAYESAVKWLEGKQLANVEYKKAKDDPSKSRLPYAGAPEDRGALELSGAIFEAELDLTHPIAYGYRRSKMPVFRGSNEFLEPAQGPYAMPLAYTEHPLLAGYMHSRFSTLSSGSASIIVSGLGGGKVICMADNTNFRAFWYGTNKLLANAVFFGNTISGQSAERPRKK